MRRGGRGRRGSDPRAGRRRSACRAVCALTVSFWKGAVGALSTLVIGWAAATVSLPALAALVLDISSPSPSRLAHVERSRAVADRMAQDSGAAARWLAGRGDLAVTDPDAGTSPEVGRLASQRLTRAALAEPQRAFDDHAARVEIGGAALRLASPALVLDDALQRLAGTDARRQRLFVAEADAYAGTLRDWFEPRVLANIGKRPKCRECPGRLNFTDHDAVPVFRSADASPASGPAALAALYLGSVTAGIALLARRRYVRWPL